MTNPAGFGASASIGGTSFSIPYLLPSKELDIARITENLPFSSINISPLFEDYALTEASITPATEAPYFVYYVDTEGVIDAQISFPYSETNIDIDWTEFPDPITIRVRSYLSLNNNPYYLVRDLTHTFTETNYISPPLYPDPFYSAITARAYIIYDIV